MSLPFDAPPAAGLPRRRAGAKFLRRRPPAGRHAGGGQQNIRALEEKLALRLFQRNTHNVLLTDEGSAAGAGGAAVAGVGGDAGKRRRRTAGAGRVVRVTMIPGFGRQMLMPLIPQFLERYPQIDLDLSLDARVVNLVGEGFDVGIGSRVDPDSRLVARPLYPMHMVLAASPDYLARRGEPQTPRPAAARLPAAP